MSKVVAQELEVESDPQLSAEALAKSLAATGVVPKNFRQQADMEAFYRFVNDNDLREDALTILDQLRAQKSAARTAKNKVKH